MQTFLLDYNLKQFTSPTENNPQIDMSKTMVTPPTDARTPGEEKRIGRLVKDKEEHSKLSLSLEEKRKRVLEKNKKVKLPVKRKNKLTVISKFKKLIKKN